MSFCTFIYPSLVLRCNGPYYESSGTHPVTEACLKELPWRVAHTQCCIPSYPNWHDGWFQSRFPQNNCPMHYPVTQAGRKLLYTDKHTANWVKLPKKAKICHLISPYLYDYFRRIAYFTKKLTCQLVTLLFKMTLTAQLVGAHHGKCNLTQKVESLCIDLETIYFRVNLLS